MTLFSKHLYTLSIATSLFMLSGCGTGSSGEKLPSEDPLFEAQWHLENTGQTSGAENGGVAGEDINVLKVWEEFTGSKEHAIAILDSGIDIHPDLKDNLDISMSYRYMDGTNDPTPTTDYLPHGTAVAGIIAAKGWNGIGTRGVAPDAKIVSLNVISSFTEANLIDALSKTDIAISSNSWGFSNNDLNEFESMVDAMRVGSEQGREGKGTIYVFSAGNSRSRSNNSNANMSSLTNNPYAITVASVNADGKYASYSNFGSSVLVSGTGGEYGIDKPAIVTTDLVGLDRGWDRENSHYDVAGNENGDYTNTMTGTSAACPTVTGVVALMLDANPDLSWRDVRYILAKSARKNDIFDGNWTNNAAGLPVNYNYGFGVVDAYNAVEMSKTFENLSAQIASEASQDLNISIPDDGETALTSSIEINDDIAIEHVDLWISIKDNLYGRIGDLEIKLTSPQGTESILAWGGVRTFGYYDNWRFGTERHLDESSLGTWKLSVKDVNGDSQYTLTGWKLKIYGHTP
ncbi:MAG: S8 family serine peptidase [Sulfurovum sp.]|nr:S8 family serine peptidase [Sulfurovum sp.]